MVGELLVNETGGSALMLLLLLIFFSAMAGFSLAMALIGDSPWSDFWLEMARTWREE